MKQTEYFLRKVWVTKQAHQAYDGMKRVWRDTPLEVPLIGYIIGVRYVQEGFWREGGFTEDGDPEPNYLSATDYIKCFLVVTHIRKTPMKVLEGGFTFIEEIEEVEKCT